MWFWKIMVRFFMSLDTTLFNFIGTLYDLLIAISRTSILTQGDIAQFAQRIELLLGIFMLFKLSFSLITYIVNPDDFSDKQKGFGKLIQSAVISLLMLVLVPYIFQMAFNLQAKILDDNLLAKLLLGEKISSGNDNTNIIDSAGDTMAFQVMLPFFKPRYSIEGLESCINIYDKSTSKFSNDCKTALEKSGLKDSDLNNYVYGIENESLGLTFRANTALVTTKIGDDEQFVIDYKYPLSTVVAVVVCLLLVTFCIDIGVRSVKLAFLQLIYPIPVISYMDPKSGKDGIFKKWYQMCFSTYLSLFMRLLALYFGVYIITKVADLGMYDIINGSQVTNGWVQIFIIIGVLMFVKQLPKILENMGIKLDGDGKFTLNPFKKIEEGAIGLKKPMENFRKNGYGVGLGAKKVLSGLDSARAGKGFMNGMRKIQGNGSLAKAKKWYQDITPERTGQLKKSREAKADLNHKRRIYNEGNAINNKISKYATAADPDLTVKNNVSNKKKDFASAFVDEHQQARNDMSEQQTNLNQYYKALGDALVEQYGGDTAKNREYARVSVEKIQAETEMRRLRALQRQAYDPNTGEFKLENATDIRGNAILNAEELESAIETQQKILKSVGEYADKEKDFQFKNGDVDAAIGVSKGMEPRRNDLNR